MSDVVGLYRSVGVKLPAGLGDGWASTRCFAGFHHDRHPSARVHLRSGGFRCFACGTRGGVLDALQLLGVHDRDKARVLAVEYGVIDPPRRKKPQPPQPPAASHASATLLCAEAAPVRAPPTPSIGERVDWEQAQAAPAHVRDRTWVYTDEHGAPVGRVRRLDLADGHKRVWQERPDGDQWTLGLNGGQLPLYRLPQVLDHARQGARVLVVEGEKAVDALDRVGVFATTNAGGAGKWRDEHTAALEGATVTVCCDSDQPGRLHAHEVSSRLLAAGVNVRMPYDPAPLRNDGFDVVDELANVAAAAREVTPGIDDNDVRERLRSYLSKPLAVQQPASAQALQRWLEHAGYLAGADDRVYVDCDRCGERRVHRLAYGLAYCPCGQHRPAP